MKKIAVGLALAAAAAAGCDDSSESPLDREPPPIPAGVYTITGDRSVEVRWSPMIGSDIAGYSVYSSLQSAPASSYSRIGDVPGASSDSYIDSPVANGVTRYYAVSAYDFAGNESALSTDLIHDTPRPAGRNLVLYTPGADPQRAAVDWSRFAGGNAGLAVPANDPLADFVIEAGVGAEAGLLFMVGTAIDDGGSTFFNQLQDFGFTTSLDEVDWAPDTEDPGVWAQSPFGVELVPSHSYVIWTWDDYYAKFRVLEVTNAFVRIDWAYQATDEYDFRFELAPGWKGGAR